MTPEEAYEEARRRIRKSEETGAVELDLYGLALNRLPRELAGLTSLQSLKLSWCEQLKGDLTPLAGLTSLQSLDLLGCKQLSGDLAPLASLTSLRSLNLYGCNQLRGGLTPLASLTSLQWLNLSGCKLLSDLSPLASLASLQSLNLSKCEQLSDLTPLAGLTSLQTLYLDGCLGVRRFAPLESLLPTLKQLSLFGCKLDDLPPEVCGETFSQNVLVKVRAHYEDLKSGQRIDASPKTAETGPPQPLATLPRVFVSYAWGDISPIALEEDRQRQEVVERLCRTLEKENWQVVRDKTTLKYGDPISTFMKMLGQADLLIVVLSAKYLRSPYCMTELHALYQNARQERQEFLNRIIPLVLKDTRIGTPEERVEHAKHWETRYLKLKADLDYLSDEDFGLYRRMKDWYNHVGNMLTYVNDVLHPHGFEDIVKDDFAALRQMLSRRR